MLYQWWVNQPRPSSMEEYGFSLLLSLFMGPIGLIGGLRLLFECGASRSAWFRESHLYRYIRSEWKVWMIILLIACPLVALHSITWFANEVNKRFVCGPIGVSETK
jgi:hypothetical protein